MPSLPENIFREVTMGKKSLATPRGRVRSAIRKLWLRSRERAAALKRDGYTCQKCHRKQSKAIGREFDVQVHHLAGIGNWEKVIDMIFEEILCSPDQMQTICKECHHKEHGMVDWSEEMDKSIEECGL